MVCKSTNKKRKSLFFLPQFLLHANHQQQPSRVFYEKMRKRQPQRSFHLRRPLILPPDDGLSFLERDGQPDVACIDRMARPPHIGHEDVLTVNGQYKRGLSVEGFLSKRTAARIGMLRPWAPDAGSGEHASLVGCPACAARGNHPVSAVVLEDGRRLILSTRSHTGISTCMV